MPAVDRSYLLIPVILPLIAAEMNESLIKPFSADEMWGWSSLCQVVMPGPDGLSGTFYKQYLDVVSGGVVRAIQNFAATRRLPNNFCDSDSKGQKTKLF